jgi:hypothetical protein
VPTSLHHHVGGLSSASLVASHYNGHHEQKPIAAVTPYDMFPKCNPAMSNYPPPCHLSSSMASSMAGGAAFSPNHHMNWGLAMPSHLHASSQGTWNGMLW